MLPEIIEAERFRLRPYQPGDVDVVFDYARDEAWLRYLPIPSPYTRADAESFLAAQAALDRQLNPSWAIEVEGAAAGGINIRFFADHRVSELGYAVSRALWGRGFATEAARLVIAAAFDGYPQLNRVRATADARNAASIRVLEKLGMTREGLLREDRLLRDELTDHVVYGVLRREWRWPALGRR